MKETALIVVISPGTGVLYTLAAALTRGSRAGIGIMCVDARFRS